MNREYDKILRRIKYKYLVVNLFNRAFFLYLITLIIGTIVFYITK